ncbi:MAG: recombinase family protein [Oscillospiraceae bacterium]|nr:recombinase family protein [Oscillospiraceae bacterium]
MGKRKQPFGYKMEMGRIVVNPKEAEIVTIIYEDYANGKSLKKIADSLNGQQVCYCEDKLWNKNMVARILEDKRYTGIDDYPAIVNTEQHEFISRQKSLKNIPCTRSTNQRLLRSICGKAVKDEVELQIKAQLNRLIENPDLVVSPVTKVVSAEVFKLQKELDDCIYNNVPDDESARILAVKLASAKYEMLGNEEYETIRIKSVLSSHVPMTDLDPEILKSTVSKIKILNNGKIELLLKNNQIIGRS